MIYKVRTKSGKEYLTSATEPAEAINSKNGWTTITFATLTAGVQVDTGNTVVLRGCSLESVEMIPDGRP
jgi:hypothetical protein